MHCDKGNKFTRRQTPEVHVDLQIRGKVALITGASSGLGEAVALALAAEGATIAVAARRLDLLDSVALEAKRRGAAEARAFAADLTAPGAIDTLLREVREQFGDIQILVANSGGPKAGTFLDLDLDDWDTGYRGTLRSMLGLVQGVIPAMTAAGWGRIVALTSSSVKQPLPNIALSDAFRTPWSLTLKPSRSCSGRQLHRDRTRVPRIDCAAWRRRRDQQSRRISAGRSVACRQVAPLVAFLWIGASIVTGQAKSTAV